ncbi:MAG: permease of the major facilitator superfamily, partial [Microbacterium sp.]|nr:permease of the major facilitator superfamily [Microbacterium sp.]
MVALVGAQAERSRDGRDDLPGRGDRSALLEPGVPGEPDTGELRDFFTAETGDTASRALGQPHVCGAKTRAPTAQEPRELGADIIGSGHGIAPSPAIIGRSSDTRPPQGSGASTRMSALLVPGCRGLHAGTMTTSTHPPTGTAPVPIRPGAFADVPTWRYLGFLLGPGVGTFAFNAVTVILPTLRERFGAGDVALELVIAGYGIPFAVLLILGGRLGDRFGRHRLYVVGMGLFLVSAIACALAPSIETLIAARIVQGVGAALCTPQVLATIQATSQGAARTRAIAAFGASGGIGAAVGQVAGGALAALSFGPVEGWRAVFVVVALIAVAAITFAPLAPRSRAHEIVAIDLAGTAALGLGILAASLALTFGPAWNWSWPVGVALVIAAVSLVAMWKHQNAIERS